ncbi:MAG: ABC transporter substrate-binding protein [Rhodospirillaceae bacterium]|nr:ABC transporter substrate-binding protein [Rhodospirillaceae bacterium]
MVVPPRPAAQAVRTLHALAMHGDPKYGPDFNHFDYVNPDAPRGGEVHLWAAGTFDSFNPFIIRGNPAAGSGRIYETLMTPALDEPFTHYGLIAESVELPEDRSWVAFNLRPQARWHDGRPITAEDVVFTFNLLMEKGNPFYRSYYAGVDKVEALGERKVKFTFKASNNRELPLIVGELPVLPKHYWEGRDFDKPTLEVPLGSGPYKIDSFEPGRSVTLRRVPDYWGKDLPVEVGQNNFDVIRYDYYRDSAVAFEAFKAGAIDIYVERSSKNWAERYGIPQVRDGRIVKEEIKDERTQGMQGYIFNLRRPIFQDRRVREALTYAYDFEWMNKNLSDGRLVRTESYFAGSELASHGLPQGEELQILEKFRGRIPDEVFTKEYHPPKTDGSGNIRAGLREALRLFKEAGWELKGGKLVNVRTGQPFTFEILLQSDPAAERTLPSFLQNLQRMGVTATVRPVDSSQFIERIDNFDFDMITAVFPESESPGNEQRDFWGSAAADTPGSRNLIGIKDPVIDELIELVISADTRESLVARVHALDRVLLWGHYLIPQFYVPYERVAYWNRFSHPAVTPKYAPLAFDTWWYDAGKAAALQGQTN